MKKVLKSQKKYRKSDLIRFFLLFLGHIFSWVVFIVLLFVLKYIITKSSIQSILESYKIIIFYTIIASPIVSYVLHVIYSERGWTSIKAILWIHSMAVILSALSIFLFINL